MIIAHTVKGKGVDFMENDVKWHYGSFDSELGAPALESVADQARRKAREQAPPTAAGRVNHDRGHGTDLESLRRQHDDAGRDLRRRAVRAGQGRPAHRRPVRPISRQSPRSASSRTGFPQRFFNVGIAEQNMFGMAAGMAKSGPGAVRLHHGGVRQHAGARAGAHRHLLSEPRRARSSPPTAACPSGRPAPRTTAPRTWPSSARWPT